MTSPCSSLVRILRQLPAYPARIGPWSPAPISSCLRQPFSTTAAAHTEQNSQPEVTKHVIYRGRWILPARFLVRTKVFQLMGMLGLAAFATTIRLVRFQPAPAQPACDDGPVSQPRLPGTSTACCVMHVPSLDADAPASPQDEASTLDLLAVASMAAGTVVASNSLWYYSRRYVGEMSLLLPQQTHIRFSSLDFWGNREVGGSCCSPRSASCSVHRSSRVKGYMQATVVTVTFCRSACSALLQQYATWAVCCWAQKQVSASVAERYWAVLHAINHLDQMSPAPTSSAGVSIQYNNTG
jgi:hypothetical protein